MTRNLSTVQFSRTGDPYEVLDVLNETRKSSKLAPDEVEIKMLFSPLNSSDVERIEGRKGAIHGTPCVAGEDGVAEIVSVGAGVKNLSKGDWVVPLPGSFLGTWCSSLSAKGESLLKVPNDIPVEYASGLGLNASTAYHLLHSVTKLKSGDVIIQSAANSAIGIAIIQMAKSMGVKTINMIRSRPYEEDTGETLASIGADIIVHDEYLHTPDFYSLISDIPAPTLAFDAVGGKVGTDLLRALGNSGTLVKYGNLSGKNVEIPQSVVNGRNLKVHDFSIGNIMKACKPKDRQKMIDDMAEMIRNEKLIMFFETHPFSQLSNALDRYYEPFKFRKVLLDMSI